MADLYTRIATKKQLDLSQYKLRHAQDEDYDTLISEPTVIYEPGNAEPKIVYLLLQEDNSALIKALQTIDYKLEIRTGGMMAQSRTVGFLPRNTLRRDYCTATSCYVEHPDEHDIIVSYAAKVAHYYQEFAPLLYQQHMEMTEKVLENWKIDESVFTSGIVNKNNPLPYHFDAGNFRDVWSNMIVLKRNVLGGYLAVPEYGLGFELRNNSLLMFDGQNILHGVTPITQLEQDSFRYSIVYYSMQQMWKCLPPRDEIERIQRFRLEREEERMQRQLTGERFDPTKKTRRTK